MLFTNRDLRKLLIPLILEQLLTGFMGIADTLMVTRVGSAAISAVSCADSVNTLMLYIFSALATGGTIVCSQYLGREDRKMANLAARQVLLLALGTAIVLTVVCGVFRGPLLHWVFGSVEEAVMTQALQYFVITVLSYPFLAVQQASAALFRAEGNSRLPMGVSLAANCLNIGGNAILIFGFHLGVVGAAASTLAARAVSAVALLLFQRRKANVICIRDYAAIRPNGPILKNVIRIGIPSGIENGLFQFGKLIVQSTVSTLGTTAIAAQAMISTLDNLQSIPGTAIGLGVLTVIGRCMGAGQVDQAKYYTKKLCLISEATIFTMSALILALTKPITWLAGMEAEPAALAFRIVLYIAIAKVTLWVLAFILPNSLRAAGDVGYTAAVSSVSMWVFRVGLSALLCRVFGVGLVGVWIAWFVDWVCRLIFYVGRYHSGKWLNHAVLRKEESVVQR